MTAVSTDILAEVISFAAPTSSITQNEALTSSYWGDNTPSNHMLLAFTNTGTSAQIAADMRNSIGWATDTVDHSIGLGAFDGVPTTFTARRHSDTHCAAAIYGSKTTYERAAQSSYSSTAVGHTWSESAIDGAAYGSLVLGGSGVHEVKIQTIETPTSTGDISYIDLGFTPDLLICLYTMTSNSLEDTSRDAVSAMGFSDGTTDAVSVISSRGKLSSSSDTAGVLCTDFIRMYDLDTKTTLNAATVKSFDYDGYTLNFSTVDSTARKVTIIAIKGPRVKVAFSTQPTSNSANNVEAGFTPKAGICISAARVSSQAVTSGAKFMVGAWDENNNNIVGGWLDQHGVTTSNCDRYVSDAHAIRYYNHSRVVTGSASVSGTGTGIRETWADVDGLEREHVWLLLGDAPSAPTKRAEPDRLQLLLRLQRTMEIELLR